MHKRDTAYWLGLTLLVVLATLVPRLAAASPSQTHVEAQLAGLAVPFLANLGQSDPRVAYYAQTFSGTVFVTHQGDIVHALAGHSGPGRRPRPAGWTLTESFVGGHAAPVAAQASATNVSLFSGNEPGRWRAHVATYAAVGLGEVYPGISVQLKAYGKQVEKVFTVQPGAVVAAIRVRVTGAQGLAVTPEGALAVRTGLGEVRLTRPVAYQEVDGQRHAVAVAYAVAGNMYGFRVTGYDVRRPVVIDPLLQATYLGGSGSEYFFAAMALNATTGEVYVAGTTYSTDFPGTGGADSAYGGEAAAFVVRLNPTLTTLDQATYGGAIFNFGTVTLTNSTLSGNSAIADGAGIYNFVDATLHITNSTLSGNGNSAGGRGGAIFNYGTVTLTNSTLSANSAHYGGGILSYRAATLTNSIVTNNSPGGNCSLGDSPPSGGPFPITDGGYNVDDGTTCGFMGTGCTTSGTSFCNTNPVLDPTGRANNGGPTQTIALLTGSPAIDGGDDTVCAAPPVNNLDQRGLARPGTGHSHCSIGAFEFSFSPTRTRLLSPSIPPLASGPSRGTPLPISIGWI